MSVMKSNREWCRMAEADIVKNTSGSQAAHPPAVLPTYQPTNLPTAGDAGERAVDVCATCHVLSCAGH